MPVSALALLSLLVVGAGDTLRVHDQRHDQRDAGEQQRPVAREPEPLVEGVRDEARCRDQACDEGAGNHRDPADIGERDQSECREGTELRRRHAAELIAVHHARDARDHGRESECCQLDHGHVDAGGCCCALVRAHRQHLPTEARSPHVGDQQAQADDQDEQEEAEDGARQLAVEPAPRCIGSGSRPPSFGSSTGAEPDPPPHR